MSKTPNLLTDEELLKQLEEFKNTTGTTNGDALEFANDIPIFLTVYNIKPGNNAVRPAIIYSLYKQWSKDPLPKTQFSLEIGKFIAHSEEYTLSYLLINESAINLSKKTYQFLKKNTVDKTKSRTYQKHFQSYLRFYGIETGKCWITGNVLFYLYDKWCYNNNYGSPMGYVQFIQFLKVSFEYKRRTNSKIAWFAVTDVNNLLTEEEKTQLKEGQLRRAKKKRSSKRNKTT